MSVFQILGSDFRFIHGYIKSPINELLNDYYLMVKLNKLAQVSCLRE
jgi:hypothetical protein